MSIVILGMHLQPLHRPLAIFLGKRRRVDAIGTDDGRPLTGSPFNGIVGGGNGNDQRVRRAGVPAPVAQSVKLGGYLLLLQIFQADTVRAAPVHPVVGVVEFHTNVAHQPAARHVLAGMAGKAGLGQVLCHVERELFDHRPATNQVVAHGPGAELVIAHALVQFVFDNPALTLAAILDQFLSPGGVTCSFHEGSGSVE
ncbi:hypothetical protein D3C73_1079120 [compost metagenome]